MCLAITGCTFFRPHRVDAGLDMTGIYTIIYGSYDNIERIGAYNIHGVLGRALLSLWLLLMDRLAYDDRDVHDL